MRQSIVEASGVFRGIEFYQVYDGPTYTPEIIAGILLAHQLPAQPDLKSPCDETGNFLLTAYPPQDVIPELFQQDLLIDWHMRRGLLVNRHVGYFLNVEADENELPHYITLIVRYSRPKTHFTQNLWKKHGEKLSIAEPAKLLKSPVAKRLLDFYESIEFTVAGLYEDQKALMPMIKRAIKKIVNRSVYINASNISVEMGAKELPVILLNDLLLLLRKNKPVNNALALELSKAQRQQCQRAILKSWDILKDNNELIYKQILSILSEVCELKVPSDIKARSLQIVDHTAESHIQRQLNDLPLELLTSMLVSGEPKKHLDLLCQYKNPHEYNLHPADSKKISQNDWDKCEATAKEPESDSKTSFVQSTKFKINKLEPINFQELKPSIAKKKQKITDLINHQLTQQTLQGQEEKIRLVDSLRDFHELLNVFLDCYSDIIDFTAQRGKLEQRKFKDKMDEEQEFLFKSLFFVSRIMDHVILSWNKIIERINKKIQLSETESKASAVITKNMRTLYDHNKVLLARLDYYVPIVTNLNHLRIHFGLIINLINDQIRTLNNFEAAYVPEIISRKIFFDDFLGLLGNINYTDSIAAEREQYLSIREGYFSELKEVNLSKLHEICRLQCKYSKGDANMNFSSIAKDMATAAQINFFASLCITNNYSEYHARQLQENYLTSLKNQNLSEKSGDLDKFVECVVHFCNQVNLMLNGLPSSVNKKDKHFFKYYNKIIWPFFNLNDILVSIQRVVCVLSLLVQELLNNPAQLLLSAALQQHQIDLLKLEIKILDLMNNEKLGFISKWCCLENGDIKMEDVTELLLGESSKYRVKSKVKSAHQKIDLYEGLIGFKIATILKIQEQLIDSLAGNRRIRLFEFPQPTPYEQIVAAANKNFSELMDSEAKPQEQEQKNSPKPAPAVKKKPRRKSKIISKSINPATVSKEDKCEEKKLASKPLNDTRQKFLQIQRQFQNFVVDVSTDEQKLKIIDDEIKQQLLPLFTECKEQDLKVEIYNLYADYFILTSQKLSRKDLLNSELIDRLNVALTYKKIAITEFKSLPETDLSITHCYFFDDNVKLIENLIRDVQQAQKDEMDRVCARLEYLAEHREEAIASMGDRWFINPNPKNENLKLHIRKSEMIVLGKKIIEANTLFNSMTNSFQPTHHSARLDQDRVRILRRPPVPEFSFESKSEQDKCYRENKLTTEQLDEKIADGIKKFQLAIDGIIKTHMGQNGMSAAPTNFFPAETLKSVVKFMHLIRSSTDHACQIYAVGGLVVNLLQKKSVAEQDFNYLDADIVTDVSADKLIRIAKKNHFKYKITGIFLEFTAFKFRFEGINFDVISKVKFDLFQDRGLRNLNINGLYMGIDENLRCIFIDNNQLLFRLLEAQLLDILRPGLIKACAGHFQNEKITHVVPQWEQLSHWLLTSGPAEFKTSDLLCMEQTLKCFIADPLRILQVAFMLRKSMIKLKDFDLAMQTCFTNTQGNFFLPMIIEEYVLSKGGSAVNYAKIFSKFVGYFIKKAAQSLDCMAKVDDDYRAKLTDIFSKMLRWYFAESYFIRIFTLPIKMKVGYEEQKNIDKACLNLFCADPSKAPIHIVLLKNLIDLYTTRINGDLNIKMLPFVLALVITVQGGIPKDGGINELLASITTVIQKIPGLSELYSGLSTQKVPLSVKNYLTLFIEKTRKDPDLMDLEEKSGAKSAFESKDELSAHISQSIMPPPGFAVRNSTFTQTNILNTTFSSCAFSS